MIVTLDIASESDGFLFDVDGTLAVTDPLHARAYALAIEELTGERPEMTGYLEACVVGNAKPLEYLAGIGMTFDDERVTDLKHGHYRRLLIEEPPLRPGSRAFLARVEALGLAVALVSSSSRASVQAFVDTCWPIGPPRAIISRDSEGVPSKPDGAPYSVAAATLNRVPHRCVAFENSPVGATSAKAAGVRCVLLLSDGFERRDFAADALVAQDFRALSIDRSGFRWQLTMELAE